MKKLIYILFGLLFSFTAVSQQSGSVWPSVERALPSANNFELQTRLLDEQKTSCNDFSVNLPEHSTVSVYSPTGMVIDKMDISGKEKVCFGTNYPQGIYLLRISNDSFASSMVIIRE